MEAKSLVNQPRFSLDDVNITSSTTDDIPETGSFIETGSFTYNPSFASSETSIASYKTERTINSRKSRYNAPPRHKYADFGRLRPPQGLVPLGVDVPKTELREESFSSPLRALPVRDIHAPKLVEERRPSPQSDFFLTLSPPPILPSAEPAGVEDEDTDSDDSETDLHTPRTPIDQSTPPQVFTPSSFQALYISLSSAASSALVLEVSLQPASATFCETCAQPLKGKTVFAFGSIHHFGCFKCIDCGVFVASSFFTVESGGGQQPLCETDHIRRSNDLCDKCGLAVRGNYVTALDKQWHLEHFTCTICSTVLAPTDTYYEHERQLYCRQHFLASFAMMKCTGCGSEILKDYVKIADDSCWHLECYMIRKFWNVKVTSTPAAGSSITMGQSQEVHLHRILTVLNTYEKECATCISDNLHEVTNGRYVPAVRLLEKLLLFVEALFAATDDLEYKFALLKAAGIPYVKVARVLCQAIFEVLTFITKHQSAQSVEQRAAATLEILKVVARIARYFNSLIRIALRGALKLQQNHYILGALPSFLDRLHALTNVNSSTHRPAAAASVSVALTLSEGVNPATTSASYGYRSLAPESGGISPLAKAQKKYKPPSDLCIKCKLTIAEACVRLGTYQRWHSHCLRCQSCNKTAGLSSTGPSKTSTALHTQLNASSFVYEPMSIENVPLLGPVPSVVYCMEHAWPTSRSGFLPVSRLEQYTYLLVVSLRRLYARLKDPTLTSQTFGTPFVPFSASPFDVPVTESPWKGNGRKKESVDVRNGDIVQVE